jgi:hypothetical protein
MTSFLMFFAKVPNSILKPQSSSSSIKTSINGDGSFLPIASNSRIWLYSKHHSTTNDPCINLRHKQ